MRIRITGEIRWRGKQGRLEIYYDDLTGRWYVHQSVSVEEEDQTSRTTSPKRAFVDLGVINILTGWIEGEKQAIAFSGKHKRLFKCFDCGIEAHRDVVGVLNIARLHGDGFNGVLAHPSLLRVEEGADVTPMLVKPSEARISSL